jgi:hypothetical protein
MNGAAGNYIPSVCLFHDKKRTYILMSQQKSPEGTPAEIESAARSFKWSFDNHWGDHCINATYALHFFLQDLN